MSTQQYPCPAHAQEADLSLREYEDYVYRTTFVDRDDSIAEWQKVHDEQQRVVNWLKGRKIVAVKSPNADLTPSIEGCTFVNSDGKNNMPSGEAFAGPVEDAANGWVNFTYPTIRGGREVDGVRLDFVGGKVVKASAKKNEAYLLSQLDADKGARYGLTGDGRRYKSSIHWDFICNIRAESEIRVDGDLLYKDGQF